jgi:hypothetical protein
MPRPTKSSFANQLFDPIRKVEEFAFAEAATKEAGDVEPVEITGYGVEAVWLGPGSFVPRWGVGRCVVKIARSKIFAERLDLELIGSLDSWDNHHNSFQHSAEYLVDDASPVLLLKQIFFEN